MSNKTYEVLVRFQAGGDEDADYVVDKLGDVGDNVDEAEDMQIIPLTRDGSAWPCPAGEKCLNRSCRGHV